MSEVKRLLVIVRSVIQVGECAKVDSTVPEVANLYGKVS